MGRHSRRRVACLERSLAATLLGVLRRRRIDWCIGARLLPYASHAWVEVGGAPIGPVALSPLSKTGAGVVMGLDGADPRCQALFQAGYVEMHDQVLTQWDVPPYGADAIRLDTRGRWWLSAEHLRSKADAGDALLDTLIGHVYQVTGPLQADESVQAFRGWLLATSPAGLTTAALGTPLWRIGYSDLDGAALLSTIDGTDTIVGGSGDHHQILVGWAQDWRCAGRPGLDDLQPYLARTATGWLVRARHAR